MFSVPSTLHTSLSVASTPASSNSLPPVSTASAGVDNVDSLGIDILGLLTEQHSFGGSLTPTESSTQTLPIDFDSLFFPETTEFEHVPEQPSSKQASLDFFTTQGDSDFVNQSFPISVPSSTTSTGVAPLLLEASATGAKVDQSCQTDMSGMTPAVCCIVQESSNSSPVRIPCCCCCSCKEKCSCRH